VGAKTRVSFVQRVELAWSGKRFGVGKGRVPRIRVAICKVRVYDSYTTLGPLCLRVQAVQNQLSGEQQRSCDASEFIPFATVGLGGVHLFRVSLSIMFRSIFNARTLPDSENPKR